MTKGLLRSLSRGPRSRQELVRDRVELENVVFSATSILSGTGGGGALVYQFPSDQLVHLLAASCRVNFRGNGAEPNLADTWTGNFSFGTTQAAAGETLDFDRANIINAAPVGPAVAEITPDHFANNPTAIAFEGLTDVHVNLEITNSDITDGTTVFMEANGFLDLAYMTLDL